MKKCMMQENVGRGGYHHLGSLRVKYNVVLYLRKT